MNYTPPPGYIDQPYFWCFDTDAIPDGTNLQNQSISLPGGFDFVLRRLVGVDSVLNATTGEFQFRSVGDRNYGSLNLKNPSKFADRFTIPEVVYPETGGIGFDLFNTQKASLTVGAETIPYGQLAFQGVRRRKGEERLPGRNFRRIPYHITIPINFDWGYNSTRQTRRSTLVLDNFDFEMHCIYWTLNGVTLNSLGQAQGGLAKFVLYDYALNGLMPSPMRIDYLNESMPFGAMPTASYPYRSGAIYPILLYPKDSAITIDLTSLLPVGVTHQLGFHAIGMQRVPC